MKQINNNWFSVLGVVFLATLALPALAIDPPRAFKFDRVDGIKSLKIYWVNPDDPTLDHVDVHLSYEQAMHYGTFQADASSAIPNERGEYQFDNREQGQDYYFYLTATDTEGNESARTDILKRSTTITPDITSPDKVTATTVADIFETGLTLSWVTPDDYDFYRTTIYRSTNMNVLTTENNLITRIVSDPETTTTYSDTGLIGSTDYYYRLVTEDVLNNNLGESMVLATKTATPVVVVEPVVPDAPEDEPEDDSDNDVVPSIMPNPDLFDYRAEWVSQSGTVNDTGTAHVVTATAGETITLELTLKNIGSAWWYFTTPDNAHEIKIGTWNEADRASLFEASSWLSDNRVSMFDTVVPTDGTVIFSFDLTIPADTALGTYSEYFRPVAEYVEWFGPTGIFWNIEVS